jgi:hypothetical protein
MSLLATDPSSGSWVNLTLAANLNGLHGPYGLTGIKQSRCVFRTDVVRGVYVVQKHVFAIQFIITISIITPCCVEVPN